MKLKIELQRVRADYHRRIAEAVTSCPHLSYAAIGRKLGCSESTVFTVAKLRGVSRSVEKGNEVR